MLNSYESFKNVVGGMLEVLYYFNDPVLIVCNEEGKLINLPANRGVQVEGKFQDILVGTFFICGDDGENFTSIPSELEEFYTYVFDTSPVDIFAVNEAIKIRNITQAEDEIKED